MLYTKFEGHQPSGFGEDFYKEDVQRVRMRDDRQTIKPACTISSLLFKEFLPYKGMATILVI